MRVALFLCIFAPSVLFSRVGVRVRPFKGVPAETGQLLSALFANELSKNPDFFVSTAMEGAPDGYELSGEIRSLGASKILIVSLLNRSDQNLSQSFQRNFQNLDELPALASDMARGITGRPPFEANPAEANYAAHMSLLLTNQGSINARGSRGHSLLSLAIMAGYGDVASQLLEEGADPNAAAENGNTPLMFASGRYGSGDLALRLLEKGADANAVNLQGESPLVLAASWGRVETLELLLSHGADINFGAALSPLGEALRKNDTSMVQLLLRKGADPNFKSPKEEKPALIQAALADSPALVQLLLDAGADVNVKDSGGRSALLSAIAAEAPRAARTLILRGANPNADTDTPLQAALGQNKLSLVSLLLSNGANPNLPAAALPLMAAVRNKNYEAVKILLDGGADPSLKNSEGETALTVARRLEAAGIVELLSQPKKLKKSPPRIKDPLQASP